MLGTLVMLLIGVTAYVLRGRRKRDTLHVDAAHATRDMSFFLVMYSIALALALLPKDLHFLKGYLGWIFLPAYFLYLFLVLRTPKSSAARGTGKRNMRGGRYSLSSPSGSAFPLPVPRAAYAEVLRRTRNR